MKTTAKYPRFHTREVLEAAGRGEEVIVTWRGKPQARIVGLSQKRRRRARIPAFGIWKDRDEDVQQMVDRLREGRSFSR
jgi:prevent-host-death family protein